MRSLTRIESIGILVAAALMVLLPVVWIALRMPVTEFENRPLARFPKPKLSSLKRPHFYEGLTKAIEDRNPLRWYAVVAKTRFQYSLFGTISNPLLPKTVRVGRDGWLFIEEDLAQPCWSPQQILPGLDVARHMEATLATAGKLMLFTVAPNKTTAYSDHLVAGVDELRCSSRSRGLLGDLIARSGIRGYVDAFAIISRGRRNDGRLIYSPLDTHWTSLGSAYFVTELAKRMGRPIDEPATFERVRDDRRLPDLSRLSGLFYEEVAEIYRHRLSGSVEITASEVPHIGPGRPYIHQTARPRGLKLDDRKVLVLHDSFFYVSQDQLSSFFDDVLYVHWTAFDPKTFGAMARRADIVIVESVEREMYQRLSKWGPREAAEFEHGFKGGVTQEVWWAPLESSSIRKQ